MHRKRKLRVENLEGRRLLAFNISGAEQEFVQLINRFRSDPQGEYARLEPLFDTQEFAGDMSNSLWTVNRTTLRNELSALSSAPPLSMNAGLIAVAETNNDQMKANLEQGHYQNGSARRQGLIDDGVNAADIRTTSQNVWGYGKSVIHSYANAMIDWGPGPGGMYANRPHRVNLIDADSNLVGVDVATKTARFQQDFDDTRPMINTQNLAYVQNLGVHVTGAIFDDANSSGWYDEGEGIGDVNFVFTSRDGSTYTTTGFAEGGYQIELPAGTYSAIAMGGELQASQFVEEIVVGTENVWQNWIFDASNTPPPPPVAMGDLASTETDAIVLINVLGNDSNPGDNTATLVPTLVGASSDFSVTSSNQIEYVAPAGFSGVARANYLVTNPLGYQSSEATLAVFVVDLSADTPWHNTVSQFDINEDSVVSAQDALLVINAINSSSNSQLPTSGSGVSQYFGFIDSNGDGFLTALDALGVINAINSGNGEGESSAKAVATDTAINQLMYFDLDAENKRKTGAR